MSDTEVILAAELEASKRRAEELAALLDQERKVMIYLHASNLCSRYAPAFSARWRQNNDYGNVRSSLQRRIGRRYKQALEPTFGVARQSFYRKSVFQVDPQIAQALRQKLAKDLIALKQHSQVLPELFREMDNFSLHILDEVMMQCRLKLSFPCIPYISCTNMRW
jgi:hypothetical protein